MKAPRRVFLGALAAAPLVPAGLVSAETPSVSPEGAAMAEGLLLVARARFGHHLAPQEVAEVRKGIESVLRSGEKLRSVALTNADEPVAIFEARPRPSRGGARH
jgi:hypothetical protein